MQIGKGIEWARAHGKEIAIAALLLALLLALLIIAVMQDRRSAFFNEHEASTKRKEEIEQAQAARPAIEQREEQVRKLDQDAKGLKARRQAIKREQAASASPTRKEIEDAVTEDTEGDVNRLADLYRAAGYPVSVLERPEDALP